MRHISGRNLRICTIIFVGVAAASLASLGGCPSGSDNENANTNSTVNDNRPGNSGLTGKYVGSERCSLCHNHTHEHWSETRHAHALATLEAIGQDKNGDCLKCHTVGYGKSGGYKSRQTTNALAGVGCEACHGPARDHAENVNEEDLRPKIDISSEVCGQCHTGSHQPQFDQWATSTHARVTGGPGNNFTNGSSLNSCGKCHSGYAFFHVVLKGETIPDDALKGMPVDEMLAVECTICHAPHQRTGLAHAPADGRDYQLRFPEVVTPVPSNDTDDTTDPTRFNLCGQCHHDRGNTWMDTSRPSHHSIQSNFYAGEMPTPDNTEPLVLNRTSIHSFAPEQCATCHLYRKPTPTASQAPTLSEHKFTVNESGCARSGCHPSSSHAHAARETLQSEVDTRLERIKDRLGDPATWEYTSNGGPSDQSAISDEIKQVRFLYYYVANDGSLGVHNPDYARLCLTKAEALLLAAGQ